MLRRESEQLGLTVLRTWAFADGPQWNSIQPSLGQLDERVLSEVSISAPTLLTGLRAPAACRRGPGIHREGTGGAAGHAQRGCACNLMSEVLWDCCVESKCCAGCML